MFRAEWEIKKLEKFSQVLWVSLLEKSVETADLWSTLSGILEAKQKSGFLRSQDYTCCEGLYLELHIWADQAEVKAVWIYTDILLLECTTSEFYDLHCLAVCFQVMLKHLLNCKTLNSWCLSARGITSFSCICNQARLLN